MEKNNQKTQKWEHDKQMTKTIKKKKRNKFQKNVKIKKTPLPWQSRCCFAKEGLFPF
jgi:hypothetical protein